MSSATPAAAAAATPSASSSSSSAPVLVSDPYTIREGKAIIKRPPKEGTDAAAVTPTVDGEIDENQLVFYNKVQVFNRDLSILMIKTFIADSQVEYAAKVAKQQERIKAHEAAVAAGKTNTVTNQPLPTEFPGITILEALSATGLRSIRYFKEIPHVSQIIVNDMDAEAVNSIRYNIELNGLTTDQLVPSHADAITLMQQYRPPAFGPSNVKRPQVIDLDPYGTATPFLDSAVQAIDEGGLLAITCTDKSILCGNYSEKCWAKYGSMPLKGDFCHETSIRIVLNSIASACARYGRHIVPLLSMSIDFYVRVFVRVYSSPLIVKQQATNMGMILACTACHSFWPHALGRIRIEGASVKHTPNVLDAPLGEGAKCPECHSSVKLGGPFWLGPLHNKDFIAKALKSAQKNPELFATTQRIIGSLTLCGEELQDGEEGVLAKKTKKFKEKQQELLAKKQATAAAAAATATPAADATTAATTEAKEATAAATATEVKKDEDGDNVKDSSLHSLLYYSLPHLFQTVNSYCPKISLIRSALLNAGYSVSQTHALHSGIKTNAPNYVVWDVIRSWIRDNPPKNGQKKGTAGEILAAKPIRTKIDFTIVPGTDLSSNATGVAKFLPNPEDNWGPKARAGKRKGANPLEEQGKRQKLNQHRKSKMKQCKAFGETGTCKFGSACKYAHVDGVKPGQDVSHLLTEQQKAEAEAGEQTEQTATVAADTDANMKQ